MSDSSEDEDMSKFHEAVDTSFLNDDMFKALNNKEKTSKMKPVVTVQLKSQRYLETASHYNDVKVNELQQKSIGNKLSKVINETIEYVDVPSSVKEEPAQWEGGVKLFSDSKTYLSHEIAFDEETANHNIKNKKQKRKHRMDNEELDEKEKVKLTAVSAEKILSGDDTKHWKSRRKEKVFKYKTSKRNNNLLIPLDK